MLLYYGCSFQRVVAISAVSHAGTRQPCLCTSNVNLILKPGMSNHICHCGKILSCFPSWAPPRPPALTLTARTNVPSLAIPSPYALSDGSTTAQGTIRPHICVLHRCGRRLRLHHGCVGHERQDCQHQGQGAPAYRVLGLNRTGQNMFLRQQATT